MSTVQVHAILSFYSFFPGILKSVNESLFTYNAQENFAHFYDPNFNPVFETTFKNADLEDKAREVCGNDEYCLFDIAATNNVEIGKATMRGVESFDNIVVMSAPGTWFLVIEFDQVV